MTQTYSENTEPATSKRFGLVRILQTVGAIAITGFALWFLFGIPAYLLFGIFFE